MKLAKSLSAVVFLLAGFSVTFPANAITEAKEKDIKALLSVMGVSSMANQMADSMVSIAISKEKKRYPDLPKNVEYALSKAIHEVVLAQAPELDNMTVPLYDKYYTHDEIKQLIVFFNSQVGRKYAAVVGPMVQDMMPVAQAWGNKVGPLAAKRAEQELRKYGYK